MKVKYVIFDNIERWIFCCLDIFLMLKYCNLNVLNVFIVINYCMWD